MQYICKGDLKLTKQGLEFQHQMRTKHHRSSVFVQMRRFIAKSACSILTDWIGAPIFIKITQKYWKALLTFFLNKIHGYFHQVFVLL